MYCIYVINICIDINATIMARTRPGVKCNIYSIRFGSVHCTYTTAFRECIRDYLIAKGRTETRIASGFRKPYGSV